MCNKECYHMKTKRNKLYGGIIIIAVIAVVGTYKLWLPGWTITRLAEFSTSNQLGRTTEMSLFQNNGDNSYSIYSLKVYNKGKYSNLPQLCFQNIFIENGSTEDNTISYNSVECCCGDVYVILFKDGSTNFDSFPVHFPRSASFNNIRIHINDADQIADNELVVVLNGKLKRKADNSLDYISINLATTSGTTIANIVSNPEYTSESPESVKPYLIQDFSMIKLVTSKDAAKIVRYYSTVTSIINQKTAN